MTPATYQDNPIDSDQALTGPRPSRVEKGCFLRKFDSQAVMSLASSCLQGLYVIHTHPSGFCRPYLVYLVS